MKKGFTLIELLAVIVILAIIALIATPIILGIISDARNEARVRSAELYLTAVEQAILRKKIKDDKNFNPRSCSMEESGVICDGKELQIDIDGNKPTSGNITFSNGKVESYNLVIEGKEIVSEIVQTPQEPEIPEVIDKLCKLESGTTQTTGAQYTCTLDQDRTFYVLGENENDSTKMNLIMDRNYVDNTVPITMKWCSNSSNNSCNHDNLDQYITYIQGVFGNSITVSLPSAHQIALAGGDTKWTQGTPSYASLSSWLYFYLDTASNSVAPGYWTSTHYTGNSSSAWIMYYLGDLLNNDVTNSQYAGLRPVITVSRVNME